MKANKNGMARIITGVWIWLMAAVLAHAATHSATSGRTTVDTRVAGVAGRVTDIGGIGLAAATVYALQGGVARQQVATDANGYYALDSLPNGVYDLRADKTNYLPDIRYVIHLATGTTATRDFALKAKPEVPELVETNRPAPSANIVPITSDQLKIYSGGAFTGGSMDREKMTVVFTHGWNSDPTVWATGMVAQMRAGGFTNANFVAWDWETAASSSVRKIVTVLNKTRGQGDALGQALTNALGVSYGKPIHFIGHSLGTIVNAKAANFIHGPGLFPAALTHCTLLDDAEVVPDPSSQYATGSALLFNTEDDKMYNPVPEAASTWVDSYISACGHTRNNTVDGILVQAPDRVPLDIGWDERAMLLHRYAATWYAKTTANPSGSALGFANSFEMNGPSWNPALSAPEKGENYRQNSSGSELPMVSIGESEAQEALAGISLLGGNVANITGLAKLEAAASATVGAVLDIVVSQLAQPAPDFITTAVFGPQSGIREVPVFSFQATLQRYTPPSPLNQPNALGVRLRESEGESNAPCIWLPIFIPADADIFSFDYSFSGEPGEDQLVASLDGTNVFELEAKYIVTNEVLNSGAIPVGELAGRDVELFFGLLGGTSSNASVTVDAMGFYAMSAPVLTILPDGSTNVPASASTGLTIAVTANVAWAAATNAPWLSIASGEWGEGDGTVVYDVAANAETSSRTGFVTVAGGGTVRTCEVVQAGAAALLAIEPSSTNISSGAANGLFLGVEANVPWTATSNGAWIAITDGSAGTSNGTVTYAVSANGETTARTGGVVVAGGGLSLTCTVVQAGAAISGWDNGYQSIGGGWRRLSWFGDYVPMGGDGWIWHNKHGFFFVPSTSTSADLWLYAMDMGWLYTGNTLYPFIYRASPTAWLWYNGSTNPRWFRNMTTGQWENRP